MLSLLYTKAVLERYEIVIAHLFTSQDIRDHKQLMADLRNTRQQQATANKAENARAAEAVHKAQQEAHKAGEKKANAEKEAAVAQAEAAKAREKARQASQQYHHANAEDVKAQEAARKARFLDDEAAKNAEHNRNFQNAAQAENVRKAREKDRQNAADRQQEQVAHNQKERQREEQEAQRKADAQYWAGPQGQAEKVRQKAAKAAFEQEVAEKMKVFGAVDNSSYKAWILLSLLLLLAASGTADVCLMAVLREPFVNASGRYFAALLSMCLMEALVWCLWMVLYANVNKSAGQPWPWYGHEAMAAYWESTQQPPSPEAPTTVSKKHLYAAFSALFLCSLLPFLSIYVVCLVYAWDILISPHSGTTCPNLLPGIPSYNWVRIKLLMHGCLRVFPSLILSGMAVARITHPIAITSLILACMSLLSLLVYVIHANTTRVQLAAQPANMKLDDSSFICFSHFHPHQRVPPSTTQPLYN